MSLGLLQACSGARSEGENTSTTNTTNGTGGSAPAGGGASSSSGGSKSGNGGATLAGSGGAGPSNGGSASSTGGTGSGTGGSVAGSGGATPGSGGSKSTPSTCEASKPVTLPNGATTGLAECADGTLHRVARSACVSALPREGFSPAPGEQPSDTIKCLTDADCTDAPNGFCATDSGQIVATSCRYGCLADEDCPEGSICECGEAIGQCMPTDCATDADCSEGLCARYDDPGRCSDGFGGPQGYACTHPGDPCRRLEDCAEGERCGFEEGKRQCLPYEVCGIGRPFIVENEIRLAPRALRADWSGVAPELVPPNNREHCNTLADRWTRMGLMEHASVAAFARFNLQLLALGAPSELVELTNRAMRDETRHARLCFAIAGTYSGHPIGPGPLAVGGVVLDLSLRAIAHNVFLEGCIGETVAAVEAAWTAGKAASPALAQALATIAADERAHADLAWKFVAWAVAQAPDLATELRDLAERAVQAGRPTEPGSLADGWVAAHGLIPDAVSRNLRVEALEQLVLPCVNAMAARTGRDAAA